VKFTVRRPVFEGFAYLPGKKWATFLNGQRISRVFAVDEEGGRIWRYKTDERGKVLLNADKTDALYEVLEGQVRVVELSLPPMVPQ
jgi:hypothetical protein